MSKYAVLADYLRSAKSSPVRLSFSEIERIIGQGLPPSARRSRAWWSNNPDNNVMTKVWRDAGFRTERVDIAKETIVFRPEAATDFPAGNTPAAAGPIELTPSVIGRLKGTITVTGDILGPADEAWSADSIPSSR